MLLIQSRFLYTFTREVRGEIERTAKLWPQADGGRTLSGEGDAVGVLRWDIGGWGPWADHWSVFENVNLYLSSSPLNYGDKTDVFLFDSFLSLSFL